MKVMLNCPKKSEIDSNSNLRENTTDTQILEKIRRNQPAAELRSQLGI